MGTPRRAGPPYGLPAQATTQGGQFWTPIGGQYSTPVDTVASITLWDEFDEFYESDAASRGKRYFDLMKEFFQGYGEFSQVYF